MSTPEERKDEASTPVPADGKKKFVPQCEKFEFDGSMESMLREMTGSLETLFASIESKPKTGEEDQMIEFSTLAEMCAQLGLHGVIPKIYLVGPTGHGKTTVLEMLLSNLKVGFIGSDRATVCPVVYQVIRVRDSDSESSAMSVSLRWEGRDVATKPESLCADIGAIMDRIKDESDHGYSSSPMIVTIKTTMEGMFSCCIIDLPGLCRSEAVGKPTARGVETVVRTALSELNAHDLIVGVWDATVPSSKCSMFKRPKKGRFTLRDFDPNLRRTRLLMTKADKAFTKSEYTEETGRRDVQEFLRVWRKSAGSSVNPYMLVTHKFREDIKRDMGVAEYQERCKNQRDLKEGALIDLLREIEYPSIERHRFEYASFGTDSKKHMLNHYSIVRSRAILMVKEKFEDITERMDKIEKSPVYTSQEGEFPLLIQHVMSRFVRDFSAVFNARSYNFGDHKLNMIASDTMKGERATLEDDLIGIDPWPVGADEDAMFVCIADLMGHSAYDKFYNGAQAVQRLLINFALRATSIDPELPDRDTWVNHVRSMEKVNAGNADAAVADLVTKCVERLFVQQGIDYLCAGVHKVLTRQARAVVNVMFQTTFREYAESSAFVDQVTTNAIETVSQMLRRFKDQVRRINDKVFLSGTSVELPKLFEKMNELITKVPESGKLPDPETTSEAPKEAAPTRPIRDAPAPARRNRDRLLVADSDDSEESDDGDSSDASDFPSDDERGLGGGGGGSGGRRGASTTALSSEKITRMRLVVDLFRPGDMDRAPSLQVHMWGEREIAWCNFVFARQFTVLREYLAFTIRHSFTVTIPNLVLTRDAENSLQANAESVFLNQYASSGGSMDDVSRVVEDAYHLPAVKTTLKRQLEVLSSSFKFLKKELQLLTGRKDVGPAYIGVNRDPTPLTRRMSMNITPSRVRPSGGGGGNGGSGGARARDSDSSIRRTWKGAASSDIVTDDFR